MQRIITEKPKDIAVLLLDDSFRKRIAIEYCLIDQLDKGIDKMHSSSFGYDFEVVNIYSNTLLGRYSLDDFTGFMEKHIKCTVEELKLDAKIGKIMKLAVMGVPTYFGLLIRMSPGNEVFSDILLGAGYIASLIYHKPGAPVNFYGTDREAYHLASEADISKWEETFWNIKDELQKKVDKAYSSIS